MKFLKLFHLGCIFTLACSMLQADDLSTSADVSSNEVSDQESQRSCCNECCISHFGTSAFQSTDPGLWYTISTNSYPDSVPLSLQRNSGLSEGEIYLSPTGFTIGESGNYWISFTAVLQNPGVDAILIPVFLAQDEVFDTASPEIGSIVTLQANEIGSAHGTGIIKNIAAGTRISLVATNAGNPFPIDVTVSGWNISLFKLP